MFGLFKKLERRGGRSFTFRLVRIDMGEVRHDERFELGPVDATFGRGKDNDIVIPCPAVGKQHARLSFQDDLVTVTDLGTTNGTTLNGKRIGAPTPMKPGDTIRLDEWHLSLE
jgi:pSer/pThr/pTyr-binding forkhead associated (FHA) protein